jgi:hypothetical protein
MSRPNPDATEGCQYNSATVAYVNYYYAKSTHDPRFNWHEKTLVEKDKLLQRDPDGNKVAAKASVLKTG